MQCFHTCYETTFSLPIPDRSVEIALGVQSQRVVGRIMGKPFRMLLPLLADEFEWG
jgi:hypothetical protein